jgi:hypothetical protein
MLPLVLVLLPIHFRLSFAYFLIVESRSSVAVGCNASLKNKVFVMLGEVEYNYTMMGGTCIPY